MDAQPSPQAPEAPVRKARRPSAAPTRRLRVLQDRFERMTVRGLRSRWRLALVRELARTPDASPADIAAVCAVVDRRLVGTGECA